MTPGAISPLPREARPFQGQAAGIVSRLAAAVVDSLVVAALLILLYSGVAAVRFVLDPLQFTFPPASILLSVTAALIILVLYLALAWSVTGRSYGCHIMGLRVVTARHEQLRPLRAMVRAVFCALLPLGLLWCAVSRRNMSVQDIVLQTAVIYDWNQAPVQGAGPPNRWPMGADLPPQGW